MTPPTPPLVEAVPSAASTGDTIDAAPPTKRRFSDLDVLRGLFLVMMTITHLPTRFRVYSHDALGYVSAAEGFVFLSAFLVAFIHLPRMEREGERVVRNALWQRSFRLYSYHLALLAGALLTASWFVHRPAIRNALEFFLNEPEKALVSGALLVYCPPLFDILPMYILFLAFTPFALKLAQQNRLGVALAVSGALWLCAQLGARQPLQALTGSLLGGLPPSAFGAFDLLGWQFLWFLGVALGASPRARELLTRGLPRPALALAIATCLGCLGLRYGQMAFGFHVEAPFLLDKWRLAPMRLINMAAWGLVLVHLGPAVVRALRGYALLLLGRASLPVFCGHIVLCLLSFLLIDDADTGLELWQEALLIVGTFALLFALARQRASAAPRQRPA